jgi:hypothetical protein
MNTIVRRLVIAAALVAAVAPAALAGGTHVQVSGPHKDGQYAVHTYMCSNPSSVRVTAWAEGIVDGKRRTVPIKMLRTKEKGVYRFNRSWPENGTWAIRMTVGNAGPHVPVTLASLDEKGTVKNSRLVWEGDGMKECVAILNGDEDC